MKKIFGIAVIIFYIFDSCANFKHNVDQENFLFQTGQFYFNHEIDSLLHLFVKKASCKECFFEIYIDKRGEDESLICLRASLNYPTGISDNNALLKDYVIKNRPLLYTKIDSTILFIYSGIEDLITPVSFSDQIKFHKKNSSLFEYSWVIKKIKNEYLVFENAWTYPFSRLEFRGTIKLEKPKE